VVPFSPPLTLLNPKSSQIVHGLSIPLGKLGFYLPRTIADAKPGDSDEPGPSHIREAVTDDEGTLEAGLTRRTNPEGDMNETGKEDPAGVSVPRTVRRMGGTIMEDTNRSQETNLQDKRAKDRETDSFDNEG